MDFLTKNLTTFNMRKSLTGGASHIILAAIAAFVIGIGLFSLQNNKLSLDNLQKATSLISNPRQLPKFSMTNHFGSDFTNEDLENNWSFLFFGFTHCPDICPLTLSTMDQVVDKLDNKISTQLIFVSVDPKRDNPERLKEYVSHFNNKMIGLTGSVEQINLLTQHFGAVYSIPNNEEKNYQVDHSAHVFVITPDGKLVALFSTPHDANIIADDFKIISAAYNENLKS
jgi:protein SCO1/2